MFRARYRVTVAEITTEEKVCQGEWDVIDEVEVEREPRLLESPDAPKTRIKQVRGYTPEVRKLVQAEREILRQEVGSLDMARLIAAINDLTISGLCDGRLPCGIPVETIPES